MNKKLTPAQTVIIASAAVALIGSFLPWIDVSFGGASLTRTAWSDGLFPTFTWIALFGLVMAGQVLLATFTTTSLPDEVGGFTWRQIHLVLSGVCALLAVSFLIAGDQLGIGFFLSLLAAAGLLIGAIMLGNEPAETPTITMTPPVEPPPSTPPPPPPTY